MNKNMMDIYKFFIHGLNERYTQNLDYLRKTGVNSRFVLGVSTVGSMLITDEFVGFVEKYVGK